MPMRIVGQPLGLVDDPPSALQGETERRADGGVGRATLAQGKGLRAESCGAGFAEDAPLRWRAGRRRPSLRP